MAHHEEEGRLLSTVLGWINQHGHEVRREVIQQLRNSFPQWNEIVREAINRGIAAGQQLLRKIKSAILRFCQENPRIAEAIARFGAKTIGKLAVNIVTKGTAKLATRAVEKTALKKAGITVIKTAGKTVIKTAEKVMIKTANKTVMKSAGKTVIKTAGKTVVKTGGKTTLKTAGKAVIKAASLSPGVIIADFTQEGLEMAGYKKTGKTFGSVGNIGSGAVTGFMVGGPIGAAVGALTGAALWGAGEVAGYCVEELI